MNTLIKAHILIIFPLLVSCVRTENASKAFIELLENPQIPKNKINFNGAYTFISEERFSIPVTDANGKTNYVDTFYLNYPIFFFENGMVMNSRVIFVDTTEANLLLPKGSKYKFSYNIWGVYKISNDTITAKLFLLYVGKGLVKYYSETNFRGIIKNKDTIIQWHMVEPYPKKIRQSANQFQYLKNQNNLYFKPASVKDHIDYREAWINIFRSDYEDKKKKKAFKKKII